MKEFKTVWPKTSPLWKEQHTSDPCNFVCVRIAAIGQYSPPTAMVCPLHPRQSLAGAAPTSHSPLTVVPVVVVGQCPAGYDCTSLPLSTSGLWPRVPGPDQPTGGMATSHGTSHEDRGYQLHLASTAGGLECGISLSLSLSSFRQHRLSVHRGWHDTRNHT